MPFSEFSRMILDKFDRRVHMEIWYVLDTLRRRDPAAFPRLVARAKCLSAEANDAQEGFARALQEACGLTPAGLEEAWRKDLAKQPDG